MGKRPNLWTERSHWPCPQR